MNMCAQDTESSVRVEGESRWRWRRKQSESEKEMTSSRKCWAGFKGNWIKEVWPHIAPSLFLLFPLSLPLSLSLSLEMYSAGRVAIPTRLVNGRRIEYFKQHITLFLSLLTPLSFFLVRLCISQVHTWPCFFYCSPQLESAWHHAVFLAWVVV